VPRPDAVRLEHAVNFRLGLLREFSMASRCNQVSCFGHLRAVLFAASLVLFVSTLTQSQTKPGTAPPPPSPNSEPRPSNRGTDDKNDPFHDFGSPENEMRARQILKAEKKQYDENVARAREASYLASEIVRAYEARRTFNSEDAKKFEKLEKLTKRIRNEAGGSETEPDVKDIPAGIDAAVKQVAEMTDDLRKLVEKTPRHVISASVIDQANKLLGLLQHVRFAR
jgi:hypothetical protein